MGKKIKILQLAPRFPFPMDDGGKIGMGNITKEFSKQGAEVTVFTFVENKNLIPKSAFEQCEEFAHLILCEHSTKNTPLRIFNSFIRNEPLFITKHSSPKVIDFLSDIINKEKFDIVHADHSSMAPLALLCKSVQNIPAGLRLHNIEWIIWQRYAERFSKLSPQRFYLGKQAKALKKSESEFLNKMDVSFSITDIDRQRALDLSPLANVITAMAGVNPDEWKPDESITKNRNELILATTYDWIHNIDAVKWFINNVLPKVRETIPEIKLTLLGKYAPEWLKQYKDIGVNVVGYVDKVQPYLNKANIYISPLFVGGGIRIKILEAMAMSLPVVATPVAAEGINANNESGLFISQNENDFADNIINLIQNLDLVHSAGKAAREFILKEFSWEKNVGIMLNEYQRLIEQYKKS